MTHSVRDAGGRGRSTGGARPASPQRRRGVPDTGAVFDARLRVVLGPVLERTARRVDGPRVTPDRLTTAGLVLGLGCAALAATGHWHLALVTWLLSRACDGLDGPLARLRPPRDAGAGAFYDIVADFVVYGSTVVGVAAGAVAGHDARWWPFLLVLLAYYINGTALLAFSSLAERSGRQRPDGRSLSFLGGLAEGAETIAVHAVWLLVPGAAAAVATVWAAVVAACAAQRTVEGYRALR